MKSMVITAPNRIECWDVPLPALGVNDALVRICYTGICGSDVHVYKGETPTAKKDVVIGHEYSGIVEHVPDGALNPHGIKKGDKVVGWIVDACGVCDACLAGHTNVCRNLKCYGTQTDGTFREFISAPLSVLYKLPDDADLKLYALVEPMAVAVYAVRETPVLLGDTVLVIGGGPIGICTALAARLAGARKVVMSEIEQAKIDRIIDLGFEVINPNERDAVTTVKEITNGIGFNCVMEATATVAGYELLTKAGSFRSKGMNIGVTTKPLPVVPREIMNTEMYIKSIRIHQQAIFGLTVELFNSANEEFKTSLYKLISDEYDFKNLNEALEFCVKDKTYCKVMVKFNGMGEL